MSSIGTTCANTTRRSALHAKDGAETWFADTERDLLAHAPQRLRKTNGHGALSFARGRWIRRGDDDETSAHRALRDLERNLRLVLAVEVELIALEAKLGGDVLDGTHLHALRDFDIRRNDGNTHVAAPGFSL